MSDSTKKNTMKHTKKTGKYDQYTGEQEGSRHINFESDQMSVITEKHFKV
jgi:hypothetical protein